ncbi:hypothetical protein, partial [Gilvimarinus polysaccharolyticus]|uniref:hypothetical protein n=1 Tax=Gilvimarinus polysaccharolyticus TaxID=863921 RepID=UPI001E59D0FA
SSKVDCSVSSSYAQTRSPIFTEEIGDSPLFVEIKESSVKLFFEHTYLKNLCGLRGHPLESSGQADKENLLGYFTKY